MQPIILSRRLEVRAIEFHALQQRDYLTENELFLRTEIDALGSILSVSLGVGSMDDLKSDRVTWETYATSAPADRPIPEPAATAKPRRTFDLRRTYESFATQLPQMPSTTLRGHLIREPSLGKTGSNPRTFPVVPPVAPVPSPMSDAPVTPATHLPFEEHSAQSDRETGQDFASAEPVKAPAAPTSRVPQFPELGKVHEYDGGHNITDVKERLAYQTNLKAVRAFAEGRAVADICSQFLLTKERLYRVLRSHQKKGRNGLIMLKRHRTGSDDRMRGGGDD